MKDILLIIPPSWDIFQPSLSIPSLTAWLNQENLTYNVLDTNLDIFEWFYSSRCLDFLKKKSEKKENPILDQMIKVFLEKRVFIEENIEFLRNNENFNNSEFIYKYYLSINSFNAIFNIINYLSDEIEIKSFSIYFKKDITDIDIFESLIKEPPLLLKFFFDSYFSKIDLN